MTGSLSSGSNVKQRVIYFAYPVPTETGEDARGRQEARAVVIVDMAISFNVQGQRRQVKHKGGRTAACCSSTASSARRRPG